MTAPDDLWRHQPEPEPVPLDDLNVDAGGGRA